MKSADPNRPPGSREPGGATGENTGGRILDAGREAMSSATQDVRDKVERGKSTAADTAASASEVLEHAAEDFSQHGQETLARATQTLASKLSELAGQLERRSIDDLAQEAIRLARQNPGLFVAGGVALGLALSRFIKASASHEYPETFSQGSGGQYRGGPAYGTEGAIPERGYEGYEGYGMDTSLGQSTSLEQGVGASMDETPASGAGEPGTPRGPARAPSTSSNPMGGAGGQNE